VVRLAALVWKSGVVDLITLTPALPVEVYGLITWWTGVRGHGGQVPAGAGSVFSYALACERFDFHAS
jgi:hypothetical protein